MPHVQLNDQTLWFTDTGSPGPAVIALHGFPLDSSQFDAVADAVSARVRLVAYDARASGRSGWDGKPFDYRALVSDLKALLDHLRIERAVLLGAGQGGEIALRGALRFPGRIAGLVLIGMQAWASEPLAAAGYQTLLERWSGPVPDTSIFDALAAAWIGEAPSAAALRADWIDRWRRIESDRLGATVESILSGDDLLRHLRRIECPALVMHGDEDGAIPFYRGQEVADALPGASNVVAIPGAGHLATSSHPDAVVGGLIGFLSRIGS